MIILKYNLIIMRRYIKKALAFWLLLFVINILLFFFVANLVSINYRQQMSLEYFVYKYTFSPCRILHTKCI